MADLIITYRQKESRMHHSSSRPRWDRVVRQAYGKFLTILASTNGVLIANGYPLRLLARYSSQAVATRHSRS